MATAAVTNEQLELFNTLFDANQSDIDKSTGLPLTQSLNYSLRTCLLLRDSNWILSMLNIDNLKSLNENNDIGYKGADIIITQVGKI